jgi:hypothetical protein
MMAHYDPANKGGNRAAAAVLRVVDILLIRNPERTAIGVLLGLAIQGIFDVVSPLLIHNGISIGRLDWWASISCGIVVVHLPFIVWSISHRPLVNDELEGIIRLVESTNIGELEKRSAYRQVVNKCIEQFSLSGKPRPISEILAEEFKRGRERAE